MEVYPNGWAVLFPEDARRSDLVTYVLRGRWFKARVLGVSKGKIRIVYITPRGQEAYVGVNYVNMSPDQAAEQLGDRAQKLQSSSAP